MRVNDVHMALRRLYGWYGVYVPEFSFGGKRIDAAIIDVEKRWIRGFEIKLSRADFLRDEKWQSYSQFTSSLSIVCPEGLIQAEEIAKPFGLLWLSIQSTLTDDLPNVTMKWVKKPARFQRRDGLAWLYTYISVIEKELPRLVREVEELKARQGSKS